jgi:Flp pilus assembly protein TadG
MRGTVPGRARRRRSERGSQLVEAGLALTVFCAMLFLVIDAGWTLFVKSTLQHAVAEGVRYGVTGRTAGGQGQVASIKAVVLSQAMGLLDSQQRTLAVRFYDPDTLGQTAQNLSGNLVEVAVESYQLAPLAPLLRSSTPIPLTVRATDIIEPSPGGVAPAP